MERIVQLKKDLNEKDLLVIISSYPTSNIIDCNTRLIALSSIKEKLDSTVSCIIGIKPNVV